MSSNPEQKEQVEKNTVFLLVLFLIIFLVGIFLARNYIGILLKYILILDSYIGIFLNKTFGLYERSEEFLLYLKYCYNIEFDISRTEYFATVNSNQGEIIFSFSNILNYYYVINIFLLILTVSVLFYPLKKSKNIIEKFVSDVKNKNKQISLYFNDKILQNFKRKVIKGIEGPQLANADYFPAFIPEDEEFYISFISNSIEYSKHPLNHDLQRFKDLENVWKSIIYPYKKNLKKVKLKNGKTKIIYNAQYYALIRWSYINKDNIITEPKERMIFINNKNVNYPNIPYNNLFTLKNSNKYIVEYMKKYHKSLFKHHNENDDIDFTEILIEEELPIFFEIFYFKYAKTYFNIVKKNQKIDAPLIYVNFLSNNEIMEKVDNDIKNISNEVEKEKARKELFIKYKKELVKANKKYDEAANRFFPNLKYLLNGGSPEIRFMQPVIPRTYILHPINNKSMSNFDTPGIKIIVDILQKYIVNEYKEVIENQIKNLYNDIAIKEKILSKTKNSKEIENLSIEIDVNKAIISDLESSLDTNNENSRIKKLKELRETHKYEETYIISLWEYGMSLANLPTGRLSIIKKDNIVLWYALTSLGRPFVFNAAMPIEVMRQYEIDMYKRKQNVAIKYEDSNISTIKDIFDEEFYNKIKEESL